MLFGSFNPAAPSRSNLVVLPSHAEKHSSASSRVFDGAPVGFAVPCRSGAGENYDGETQRERGNEARAPWLAFGPFGWGLWHRCLDTITATNQRPAH